MNNTTRLIFGLVMIAGLVVCSLGGYMVGNTTINGTNYDTAYSSGYNKGRSDEKTLGEPVTIALQKKLDDQNEHIADIEEALEIARTGVLVPAPLARSVEQIPPGWQPPSDGKADRFQPEDVDEYIQKRNWTVLAYLARLGKLDHLPPEVINRYRELARQQHAEICLWAHVKQLISEGSSPGTAFTDALANAKRAADIKLGLTEGELGYAWAGDCTPADLNFGDYGVKTVTTSNTPSGPHYSFEADAD